MEKIRKILILIFILINYLNINAQVDTIINVDNNYIYVKEYNKCSFIEKGSYVKVNGICYTTIDNKYGNISVNDIKNVSFNMVGTLFELQMMDIKYQNDYDNIMYINQGVKMKRNSIYLFIIGLGILSNDYKNKNLILFGVLTSSISLKLYIKGNNRIRYGGNMLYNKI